MLPVPGDVGSGKTLVAMLAMLTAIESKAQAASSSDRNPRRQHHATLRTVASIGVRVAILTGREKGKVREAVLMGLADGSIDILVGTHAIFQEKVAYKKLGLAVIDEQHRFGVSQRLLLAAKAGRPPHLLVMTATPIPRTLTLTQYGEMDVSAIDEMPPAEPRSKPGSSATNDWPKCRRLREAFVRRRPGLLGVPAGRGERNDRRGRGGGTRAGSAPALRRGAVGLVHGRMKGPDKDMVMARFASGELACWSRTTVIEVGGRRAQRDLDGGQGAERLG